MLICSSRRKFYCVIYYSNFWHTFVPYIFYLPETSLCSTGTLRASWRCDSIMSSYSSLHALQLACHVEQHLQQTRTPLLMLAASGVYASGWGPSVCLFRRLVASKWQRRTVGLPQLGCRSMPAPERSSSHRHTLWSEGWGSTQTFVLSGVRSFLQCCTNFLWSSSLILMCSLYTVIFESFNVLQINTTETLSLYCCTLGLTV